MDWESSRRIIVLRLGSGKPVSQECRAEEMGRSLAFILSAKLGEVKTSSFPTKLDEMRLHGDSLGLPLCHPLMLCRLS